MHPGSSPGRAPSTDTTGILLGDNVRPVAGADPEPPLPEVLGPRVIEREYVLSEQQWNWYQGEETNTNPQPPQETPAIKNLREKAEADSKTIKELKEQLDGFSRRERERNIGDVLNAKGLDPKVAKLVPGDIEPTPEKVEAWLGEYGNLFVTKAGGEQEKPADEAPSAPSTVPEGDQKQYQQASQAGVGQSTGSEDDLLAKLMNAKTPEELDALIAQQR